MTFRAFNNVDFDGNELSINIEVAVSPVDPKLSDNEAIFLASINEAYRSIETTTETVSNFVGLSLSSASSSSPSGKNKNGLLHFHTV